MGNMISHFIPAALKNRLFVAFILLILLPFSVLNLYNFGKVEAVLRQKVSGQSLEQMKSMKKSLEDLMSVAFRTFTLLEQDSVVASVLKKPDSFNVLERQVRIERSLQAIINSLFIVSPQVYYTLIDLKENVYTSYQPSKSLNYSELSGAEWFKETLSSINPYKWRIDESYVHAGISQSPNLLTISAVLKDENYKPYAVARVSIDYSEWFKSVVGSFPNVQDYFLISQQGDILAQSDNGSRIGISSFQPILAKGNTNGYYVDSNFIVNYSVIPSLNWYMVERVPFDVLYSEIKTLKKYFFITFFILTAVFIVMTFVISAAITGPLRHLQKKMSDVVRKNLKVHLPESGYKGEILQLTQSFNQMVNDIGTLVQQLRMEERQKEALHFQMLLAQMKPHFLLNTLNTIKWIALDQQSEEIAEICVSLGKLLETSLNSEKELIYLQEELDLVSAFVYIQKIRYKRKFEVHYEFADALKYALVPKLSLQPLVENSIQHGLSGSKEKGQIRIRVYEKGQHLWMEIEDNGAGLKASNEINVSRTRKGIGIANIKQRLNLLFKENAALELIPLTKGTLVRIYFPLLISIPYIKEDETDVEGFNRGR